MDIRISGFGGQGIIKAGFLVGKAASLFDKKHATLNQSFGPEARGGACSAQVIVSDSPVFYPYIMAPEILVLCRRRPTTNSPGIFTKELSCWWTMTW